MTFRARDFVSHRRDLDTDPDGAKSARNLRRTVPVDHLPERVSDLFAEIAAELRAAMPELFVKVDQIAASHVWVECAYERCDKVFPSTLRRKFFCSPSCSQQASKQRQRKRTR